MILYHHIIFRVNPAFVPICDLTEFRVVYKFSEFILISEFYKTIDPWKRGPTL